MAKSKNMVQIDGKTAELVSGVVFKNQLVPLVISNGRRQYKQLYLTVARGILSNLGKSDEIQALNDLIQLWLKDYDAFIKGNQGVTHSDFRELYISWDLINKCIMGNSDISIIASISANTDRVSRTGAYGNNEGNYLASNKQRVFDDEGNPQLYTGVLKKMFEDFYDEDGEIEPVQRFDFGDHYELLHNILTKEEPNIDEYKAARYEATQSKRGTKESRKNRKTRYWDGRHRRQQYVFTQLVYGENNTGTIGRIVEVFFNHLAQYHHGHIKIKNGRLEIDGIKGSAREEESPELLANMYRWNDNDPFTAGGDIIIIDIDENDIEHKDKVKHNIQLKATGKTLDEVQETIGNYVTINTIYNRYMYYAGKMFENLTNWDGETISDDKLTEMIPEKFVKNLITSVWATAGTKAYEVAQANAKDLLDFKARKRKKQSSNTQKK